MNLKILLPYKLFADIKNVKSIVMETSEGCFGMLPNRLDCVAALVPGILSYRTTTQKTNYIAVDEGVMVKAGSAVLISVLNATGGTDLGKLGELIKTEFNKKEEDQRKAQRVIAKLERGFVYSFDKFRNH
ncbi:F-type H+-transporting ATPase subunit epsilon [Leeuwenhoekiella aestuarii]|uniref:F-type H+-transporting ATPase subunit epsilon n=1 Tax=Leeuwenhoekiella aestuarii TaxID=2249426 RepID=A0A4Q0NVI1_9FLAO|nr:F0F1 ATP synthase subunit epsilon [Leeuwenhoekiella aestuarii]RXG11640.1 F-type H+-transporting ATPase subunit epsilon [Leeuwenhoekiella aestuarii]RXG15149.1 F-type H+-transporting ATPase subunit epsilon [Leeuwenhoekiella aestuarii]